MISFSHRFHGHTGLTFVYQKGRVVRDPKLTLKFALNDRRDTYRLAVVVSKKISKSAVVRNRIRRRIYEIVRLQQDHITKPFDIVLTVFDISLEKMPHSELSGLVRKLLKDVTT